MSKNVKRSDIAKRLIELRESKNIRNQQTIADFLGIKRDTYARYETNTNPPLNIIVALSNFYDTDCNYIITGQSSFQNLLNNSRPGLLFGTNDVPYPANPTTQLMNVTEDEKNLIEYFRSMSPEKQEAYLTIMNNKSIL